MAATALDTLLFGHYRVLQRTDGSPWELGRGGMGVTYKAVDTHLHCSVALKVINADCLRQPDARERFVREARAAARLRHSNIAAVHHLGQADDGTFFYAMEFIAGETLHALVARKGPLDTLPALRLASQIARALEAAHGRGLLHRDLKPANVMVVREGEELVAKVIDFGLVKALGGNAPAHTHSGGGFLGTPTYASPEQLLGKVVDRRTDLYALGGTLWHLLTGQPPFVGNLEQIIAQHLHRQIPVEGLRGKQPAAVIALLRSLLAKKPQERPAHATAARTTLSGIARKLEARTEGQDNGRALRRMVASVCLLAAVAVGMAQWNPRVTESSKSAVTSASTLDATNLKAAETVQEQERKQAAASFLQAAFRFVPAIMSKPSSAGYGRPYYIGVLAQLEAKAGNFSAARVVADYMQNDEYKAEHLLVVADAQIEAGDRAGASQMLGEVESIAKSLPDDRYGTTTSLLRRAAERREDSYAAWWQACAGNYYAAELTAQSIVNADERNKTLAVIRAGTKNFVGARAVISLIANPGLRTSAVTYIVLRRVHGDDWKTTKEMVKLIPEASARVGCYCDLARLRAIAGDFAAAKDLLSIAATALSTINSKQRDALYYPLALAQAEVKDFDGAADSLKLAEASWRGSILIEIACNQVEAGQLAAAEKTLAATLQEKGIAFEMSAEVGAYKRFAVALGKKGDLAAARRYFKAATLAACRLTDEFSQKDYRLHEVVEAQAGIGDYEGAKDTASAANPSHYYGNCIYAIVAAQVRWNHYSEALTTTKNYNDYFSKNGLFNNPSQTDTMRLIAVAQARKGNYQGAEEIILSLPERDQCEGYVKLAEAVLQNRD